MRRLGAFATVWRVLVRRRGPGAAEPSAALRAVPRMLAQGLTGRYPGLDRGRVLWALAALVYVISPIDLVPELVIPLFGLGDDAVVGAWALGALLSEAEAFLAWETAAVRVVPGETAGEMAGDAGRR